MRRLKAGLLMAAVVGVLATGAFADDTEIARTIVERLQVEQQQGKLKGFNIGVRVDNGDVWIEGEVANPAQQMLVLDVARRVRGVNQVVNDIQVGPTEQPAKQVAAAPEKREPRQNVLAGMGAAVRSALGRQTKQPAARTPEAIATAPEKPVASQAAEPSAPKMALTPKSPARETLPKMASASSPASLRKPLATAGLPTFTKPEPAKASDSLARQTLAAAPVAPPSVPPTTTALPRTSKRLLGTPQPNPPRPNTPNGVVSASTPRLAAAANTPPPAPIAVQQAAMQAPGMGRQMPVAYAQARPVSMQQPLVNAPPVPAFVPGTGGGVAPAQYDQPQMPAYAWPAYASYPNYAGLTYPKQYSPTAWPYIGPFYPYPQVPLGWRKVVLEWDDGWWMLDFKSK